MDHQNCGFAHHVIDFQRKLIIITKEPTQLERIFQYFPITHKQNCVLIHFICNENVIMIYFLVWRQKLVKKNELHISTKRSKMISNLFENCGNSKIVSFCHWQVVDQSIVIKKVAHAIFLQKEEFQVHVHGIFFGQIQRIYGFCCRQFYRLWCAVVTSFWCSFCAKSNWMRMIKYVQTAPINWNETFLNIIN